ncbi:hypothetical protein KKD19_01815 [Patescibacteria group bacterium]|nr:hypothetical protein [Patescibacteria group bacterium]MBU4511965.1 hypothetical protein [Patescibacteria group bacterium]MCG2693369.1 hypothetical protein [Candidatus Parcubacteria bacterium]
MTDINFLPEELREKEKKERAFSKIRKGGEKVELTQPLPQTEEKILKIKPLSRRPGFLLKTKIALGSILLKLKKKKPHQQEPKKGDGDNLKSPEPDSGAQPEEGQENFWQAAFRAEPKPQIEPISFPKETLSERANPPLPPPKAVVTPKKIVMAAKKEFPSESRAEEGKQPQKNLLLTFKKGLVSLFLKSKRIGMKTKSKEKRFTSGEGLAKQRSSEMSVNLVPLEIFLRDRLKERIAVLLLVNLGCLVIIGLVYLVILSAQPAPSDTSDTIEQLEKQVGAIDEQIAELREAQHQYYQIQNKIELARELFDNHVYWTKFFKFIEEHTMPEVAYLSFGGDVGGAVNLNAVALDYYTLAQQLVVLQEATDFIGSVEINSASRVTLDNQEEGAEEEASLVNFNIRLGVKPEVFK